MKDLSKIPLMIGSMRQSLNSRIGNIHYSMSVGYHVSGLRRDVDVDVSVLAVQVKLAVKNEKTTIRIVND